MLSKCFLLKAFASAAAAAAIARDVGESCLPKIPDNNPPPCDGEPIQQYIPSGPYTNYFLSTCNTAGQVVITSPQPDSNLSIIGPRLVAAFPAGNSGVAAFFAPENGKNGSLSVGLVNSTYGSLREVYIAANGSKSGDNNYPAVGLSGVIEFNSSAVLDLAILGSIRTIRDFTEGPSIRVPEIQNATEASMRNGAAVVSRLWLDNVTTTELAFAPVEQAQVSIDNDGKVKFSDGQYLFWTTFNYPQLTQLNATAALSNSSQGLIEQKPESVRSLTFLSYTDKLLAGAWRFLTYFGRDSMITALLMQPVLSEGEGGALEAVIGAVLERINQTDGSVAHEETLGDYATYLNMQMNVTSTDPSYTYQMVDTDFYLPVLMEKYYLGNGGKNKDRAEAMFKIQAGKIDPVNKNMTWGELAMINADKIMTMAAKYAAEGNQTRDNLVHLKDDQIVGEWRDSTYGIGGARIPFDVNTALMPAALRSIAVLTDADIYTDAKWKADDARSYAATWETTTLPFFEVSLSPEEARSRLDNYVQTSNYSGPSNADEIPSSGADLVFHALGLDGNDNTTQVEVMNSDNGFRLFMLPPPNASDPASTATPSASNAFAAADRARTAFLNQTADHVRRTFPAGLLTDVGLLVANPAFGDKPVYAANWTTSAYHGTVVWGWQMALMARGLELHLLACAGGSGNESMAAPGYCSDSSVVDNVKDAYGKLWDAIEKNSAHLEEEVWSWTYDGGFKFAELGSLPPPPGVSVTESDIRQLWSLTFLAVKRNNDLS